MSSVRTRFAPSPTGFLHIGGARTALYNWAFARRHAGRLVLRVEDTDRERSTAESEQAVLEGLAWLGIDWDEGPFRQSERGALYDAAVERLLESGRAYRCTCSRESLEERKRATIAAGGKWTYDGRCRDAGHPEDCGPHTVRLRLPESGWLGWDDAVFGASGQDAREIGDRIVRRSDGLPLYHLAVVVDDVDMQVSHVIRGADHLANTPFQIALFQALEAPLPEFAHVPLIVGPGGKKLSKRRDDVAVQSFRERGVPPEAMCAWLVRIGWSHGDQESFSREEIAQLFDLRHVHRSSAQADPGKLEWLSQSVIKQLPVEALFQAARPFLEREADGPVEPTPGLLRLLDLLRERSTTYQAMARGARFALVGPIAYDEKAARKHLTPAAEPLLADLRDALAELEPWSDAELERAFEAVRARHGGVSMGKLAQPVRVAVTGTAASPGIFETLQVLGRERAVGRIAEALHYVRHEAPQAAG